MARIRIRAVSASLLRGLFLGLALFSPLIVGVPLRFGHGVGAILMGTVLGFLVGVLWLLSGTQDARSHKIVFLVVSCFLSLTLLDVVARPLVGARLFPGQILAWSPMPLVHRYRPNVRFTGTIYGELAHAPTLAAHREYRTMTFITDRFGFRNGGPVNAPLDVIALGDSYAMGDDTTQEHVWSTVLSARYGLHAYNLAVGGDGPWSEYTNLTLEIDRLTRKPQGTVVLWMLFTGNDLVDPCYPIFDKAQLPWRRGVRGPISAFRTFRNQSVVGNSLARFSQQRGVTPPEGVVAKKFVDGTDILFLTDYAQAAALNLDGVREDPNYECIKATISAMRRFADSKNLTVAIMVAPPKEEVYAWVLRGRQPWSTPSSPSGFASAVREIAREEHIPVLDLKPFLVQASARVFRESGRLLWWRDDTHWNAEGNAEVAKIAHEFYRSVTTGVPFRAPDP